MIKEGFSEEVVLSWILSGEYDSSGRQGVRGPASQWANTSNAPKPEATGRAEVHTVEGLGEGGGLGRQWRLDRNGGHGTGSGTGERLDRCDWLLAADGLEGVRLEARGGAGAQPKSHYGGNNGA